MLCALFLIELGKFKLGTVLHLKNVNPMIASFTFTIIFICNPMSMRLLFKKHSINYSFILLTTVNLSWQVVVRETNTAEQFSATLTLTINIEDANDNSPVFPAQAYETSFPEGNYVFNQFGGTPRNVITVAATDVDVSVQFRQITYSLTAVSDDNTQFSIDNSGTITGTGQFTAPNTYTLTVQASDGERQECWQNYFKICHFNAKFHRKLSN